MQVIIISRQRRIMGTLSKILQKRLTKKYSSVRMTSDNLGNVDATYVPELNQCTGIRYV